MELFYYGSLIGLFFLAYYVVKKKCAKYGSLLCLIITILSVVSALGFSSSIVELLGGKSDDLTWWDVSGIGSGVLFHLLFSAQRENL